MKLHRIGAIVSRHLYVYRHSPLRIVEMIYWPLLDLMLWGFLTLYLQRSGAGVPHFVAFFVGALILWDLLFRAQQGIAIGYLEEVWSRNLLNLFISPLTVGEFIVGLISISFLKVAFSVSMMAILAFFLYQFNILALGPSLLPFVVNLMIMGWALGVFTTSLVLRWGQAAESLAWVLAFLFQPISAVFYPVSILPPVLQAIAQVVPAAHVFEGMRAVINGEGFPTTSLLWASGLNLVYVVGVVWWFARSFEAVRERGSLAKVGE